MFLFLIVSMDLKKKEEKRNRGKERRKKCHVNHLEVTGFDLSRSS